MRHLGDPWLPKFRGGPNKIHPKQKKIFLRSCRSLSVRMFLIFRRGIWREFWWEFCGNSLTHKKNNNDFGAFFVRKFFAQNIFRAKFALQTCHLKKLIWSSFSEQFPLDAALFLTIGSVLLTVELLYLQLCFLVSLLTVGASLLTAIWESQAQPALMSVQEPLNAPFLNGLFSGGFSRGKTAPYDEIGETPH